MNLTTVLNIGDTDFVNYSSVYYTNGGITVTVNIINSDEFKWVKFKRIQAVFESIGITTDWMTNTNLNPGDCEVYVLQKY